MKLTHKDQLLQMPTIFNYYKRCKNKCNQPQTDFQTHPTEIFIALQIGGMGEETHPHISWRKKKSRTFYFSPVDRHLGYGDFKTLGNIQELHIKSPVRRKWI